MLLLTGSIGSKKCDLSALKVTSRVSMEDFCGLLSRWICKNKCMDGCKLIWETSHQELIGSKKFWKAEYKLLL